MCIGSSQVFNISDPEFVLPSADSGCVHSAAGLPNGYACWTVCGHHECSRLFPGSSPVRNVVAGHREFDTVSVVARLRRCLHPERRRDHCFSNFRR